MTRPAPGWDYSAVYDPDQDFDRYYTIGTARRIALRIAPGEQVIELGCATGLMTKEILERCSPAGWLGVDRSERFLEIARARRLASATFVTGDLDDLNASLKKYDHVLATNVLHELSDPLRFLRECREMLAPGGRVHVTLQNPHSLHRVCALELGMIDSLTELSELGARWGAHRLWTADELIDLAAAAGLQLEAREGIMLKPLPNGLMAALPEEVLEGFLRAAVHYPDSCAMNYVVLQAA